MRKLKILHWPTSYPNPSRGKPFDCIFVKEHIQSIAPYCESRVLFIPAEEPSEAKIAEFDRTAEDGILTDRIYFKTIRPLWVTNIYVRIVLFFYFLKMIFIERFYPDIIHVHFYQAGLMAILFCRLFRIRMVVTEHWTAFVGYPEIPTIRFKKAAKVFNFSKAILPVSRHLLRGIEEKTKHELYSKSTIINNSVDTKIFYFDDSERMDNPKIILMVVRLDEQKDLPNMFQALKILNAKQMNIKVKVIGKGTPSQYDSILEKEGIKECVEFLGEKSKTEIAHEMKSANILCLSSISENSPCVIGEAHCTGLPVVSTNVGGIPELLDETNGILVPPKDPEALARALEEALWEREFDRNAISLKAQQHFSFMAIGKQLFEVYQKVKS